MIVKNKLQRLINRFNKKFIITHLVWDFDGTLYQSDQIEKKLKKIYFDYINQYKTINQKKFDQLLDNLGRFSKIASHYLNKSEQQILKEIDLMFSISSLLKKNHKMVSWIEGMTQYQHLILSNSTSKAVKAGLNKIGFNKKPGFEFYPFITIIGRDHLEHSKPHPCAFKKVIEHTQQPKIRHLVIGDSWQDDIHPSKKFGMQAIHVDQISQFFS